RRFKLTDTAIRKLPTGRSWDTLLGGFGVVVYPSGKVQFILRYRSRDKRQREFRLGALGVINADEARRRARVFLGQISEGRDPAQERQRRRADTRTFDEVIDRYLAWAEDHHKPGSFKEVSRFARLHIRRHFGSMRLSELTRGHVQQVFDRGRNTSNFKVKMISWARAIWGWGERREMVGDGKNPFVIETGTPRPRRGRVLAPDEYCRLWLAIESHRHQGAIRNVALWAIEFLMLAPLRKSEALRLRWESVYLERRMILLTEHKTDHMDGAISIHISDPLAKLIARMPCASKWLFPTPASASGHIESVDAAWHLIRREAGLDQGRDRVTLHDLRRSWNSVGAALGYSPAAMGKVLGNSPQVNEAHYWHLPSTLKREIADRVGEAVANFATLTAPQSKPPFRQDAGLRRQN
ncbi:tyrosine-type recombinase/integrase, partial [Alsobacter sp. SYSU BS001988]